MENKLLLAKSITLLYRESQLTDRTENSSDLIRTVLENVSPGDVNGVNSDRETILNLKSTALEMCGTPIDHQYDITDLLQRIHINTGNDEKLYDAIKQGIEDEISESQLKRSIVNMRKSINNHFKEQNINDVLDKAARTFKFNRDKIKDINQFISEIIGQLEPLQLNSSSKDAAVLDDIDIGNDESMRDMFSQVQKRNNGTRVYKTGWPELNDMLQGGFRPGESVVIGALQHKYKTGFSLSLFKQIPLYNKPFTIDPNKKPLILRISFEDDLALNLQFLYQSLKFDETRTFVDLDKVTIDEMAIYVKTRLQVNGFHIKMMRVDPTQWTYKSICNKIIELEAQGYAVEVLCLDYLAMIPTIGCISTGPMGTDIRDLFRRVRNFCTPRGILMLTPHQLSTEAKQLIRAGTPEDQFVKEINEKGYYSGTKQLDQEVDLELYIHLFKYNKETYFAVQRGKHRIPTILADEYKFFMMKFPKGMPLPDSRPGEQLGFRKLPSATANASDDLFKLG